MKKTKKAKRSKKDKRSHKGWGQNYTFVKEPKILPAKGSVHAIVLAALKKVKSGSVQDVTDAAVGLGINKATKQNARIQTQIKLRRLVRNGAAKVERDEKADDRPKKKAKAKAAPVKKAAKKTAKKAAPKKTKAALAPKVAKKKAGKFEKKKDVEKAEDVEEDDEEEEDEKDENAE